MDLPASAELGAAFGAARLGMMVATGETSSVATPPAISATIDPDPFLRAAFDDGMDRYKKAGTAIGELK